MATFAMQAGVADKITAGFVREDAEAAGFLVPIATSTFDQTVKRIAALPNEGEGMSVAEIASEVDAEQGEVIAALETITERKQKCEAEGHSFDVVTTWQSTDPTMVLCSRCGKSWGISSPS